MSGPRKIGFQMSFNICEILLCTVGFYLIVFFTHTVSLYTFIVLLSYLMRVIYSSCPVCTFCGREQNVDEKYDQCTFYEDPVTY